MSSDRTPIVRIVAGCLATVITTAIASVALVMVWLSLEFDGPGVLSLGDGVFWLSISYGAAAVGLVGGALLGRALSRSWLPPIVAALPGFAAIALLLARVTDAAVGLMGR